MTAKDIYDKILRFSDKCSKVYCYGYGNYGKAVIKLLRESNRQVDGIIVTKKENTEQNEAVSISEIESEIKQDDGIIFAMSEKNMESIDLNYFKTIARCLILLDFELDEVKKLEYYKIVGTMPQIGYWRNQYHKLMLNFKTNMRRNNLYNKNLDPWHIIPKEFKPYCDEIINYILEKKQEGDVVELGCGLCDIIGDKRLKSFRRFGLDIDNEVIEEAKLHFSDIDLKCGSFEDLEIKQDLDFFITINFLHAIPPEELRENLNKIFRESHIEYYIADEVTGNYRYLFKIEDILPEGYVLDRIIGIHPSDGGVRMIKGFMRKGGCLEL